MNPMLNLLHTRRSVKAADMGAQTPSLKQVEHILTAAARVPDHGKTMPFYFVTFQGEQRAAIGNKIAEIFIKQNPNAPDDKIQLERNRFMRAPLVIAVIYRARRGKHPLWEQIMTAGAACQNMLLAAHSLGFVGQWLSEWYAYDAEFHGYLGLDDRDTIAGFIHIGDAPEEPQADRDRPDLSEITTNWQEGITLNKGDIYDRDKFIFPPLGMKTPIGK